MSKIMAPIRAAAAGRVGQSMTWLAFPPHRLRRCIVSLLALGELVTDQLRWTPSRKPFVRFGSRLVMGSACGAAVTSAGGVARAGALCGIVGCVVGTFGDASGRGRPAARFGSGHPAVIVEDGVTLAAAMFILWGLA